MAAQGGQLSGHSSEDDEGCKVHQFKVVILGDGSVGKSSISLRLSKDDFKDSYRQTVGLDFFLKQIQLPDDVLVSLQTWDIGGQSLGSKMLGAYISGAQAVLLVYDITSYESFENLRDWHTLAQRACGPAVPVFLVGNKSDLAHARAVKVKPHETMAADLGAASFFVSAKTGDGVTAMFTRIAAQLAGVDIKRVEVAARATVATAKVVNHPAHDPDAPQTPHAVGKKKCSIM